MGEHQGFTQKSECILIKLNGKPVLITQFNFNPEIKNREKTHNSLIPAGSQLQIQVLKGKKKKEKWDKTISGVKYKLHIFYKNTTFKNKD